MMHWWSDTGIFFVFLWKQRELPNELGISDDFRIILMIMAIILTYFILFELQNFADTFTEPINISFHRSESTLYRSDLNFRQNAKFDI